MDGRPSPTPGPAAESRRKRSIPGDLVSCLARRRLPLPKSFKGAILTPNRWNPANVG